MYKYLFLLTFLGVIEASAQIKSGSYRAAIKRKDSVEIIFNAEAVIENSKPILYIYNAKEKLRVDRIEAKNDSIFIDMPFFESAFRLKIQKDYSLAGIWIKGTSKAENLELPVVFTYGKKERFAKSKIATAVITGKWQVTFTRATGGERPAIAQFFQNGNNVSGSFLTPSGDYRFLEGVINGDKLALSCFDGGHAYFFTADIAANKISDGLFYSSGSLPEKWVAVKNANAVLPDTVQRTQLRDGEDRLNFSFKDVNGNVVSINDKQYQNKVVVIQLMGSWCPNCMDETSFLKGVSEMYKDKPLEIMAIAYELTNDEARSKASLQKFIDRFKLTYPVLIAPATVNDLDKTEKTLPQLTSIRAFPTTIFIGKDGKVKKVHSGFYGPGTGAYYETFKNEFFETVNGLLNK